MKTKKYFRIKLVAWIIFLMEGISVLKNFNFKQLYDLEKCFKVTESGLMCTIVEIHCGIIILFLHNQVWTEGYCNGFPHFHNSNDVFRIHMRTDILLIMAKKPCYIIADF